MLKYARIASHVAYVALYNSIWVSEYLRT